MKLQALTAEQALHLVIESNHDNNELVNEFKSNTGSAYLFDTDTNAFIGFWAENESSSPYRVKSGIIDAIEIANDDMPFVEGEVLSLIRLDGSTQIEVVVNGAPFQSTYDDIVFEILPKRSLTPTETVKLLNEDPHFVVRGLHLANAGIHSSIRSSVGMYQKGNSIIEFGATKVAELTYRNEPINMLLIQNADSGISFILSDRTSNSAGNIMTGFSKAIASFINKHPLLTKKLEHCFDI